jgi:DNA-binding winged helix-turn-helix (wHTH) protein/Flp pilus assembly protein TadD
MDSPLQTARFGEFRIHPHERTLQRNGVNIALSRRAFDVLLYFVHHPGRVIPKEELLRNVWPDIVVDDNNLSQSVSALRKALQDRPGEHQYITTLPGRGYQFTANVETAEAPLHLPVPTTTLSTSVVTEYRRKPSPWSTPFIALLCISLPAAVYAGWRYLHPAVSATGIELVLEPFDNQTGDAQFDHTLDRALQIDLVESPFVSLLPRPRIDETLKKMQHQPGEALTPALAVEVCERNRAQATLRPSITRLGGRYLLLFEAHSCISGKRLAGYKAEVTTKEDVLHALDSAVDRIRKQLGESAASRERYETPIMQATTPSIDALRLYSLGQESFERGDMKAAQLLAERAVALDPNFALAYFLLGTTYLNTADTGHATLYYQKAYDLRSHVSEGERLTIETVYFADGIGNLEEAIPRLKQYAAIYPATSITWITLGNLYTELGEYPDAVAAGENAVRTDPHSAIAAEVLARAYERSNRFADAKRVALDSIARGKDHWGTHSILFQIAAFEQDAAAIQKETAWMLANPALDESFDDLGWAATLHGKLREGIDDFQRSRSEAIKSGDPVFADLDYLNIARFQILFGEPEQAAKTLQQRKTDGGDLADLVLFEARSGDLEPAKRYVANAGTAGERDTISVQIGVPLAAAEVALQQHRPLDAIRLLNPAQPYLLNSFDILLLRAAAETEAGQLAAAAADYRIVLDNPGIDPVAAEYGLAHLYLARVLVLQNNPAAARAEYQAFLAGWKDADTDLPVLKAARLELAGLPSQ